MILAEKVMNIKVVQLIKIYNPTVRDIRLNLIGVWIYPRSMVECLHVTSLLSSESAIYMLLHAFIGTRTLRIYWLFTCFYLFLSWLKASMFII
jgi:hypothetical protein